MLPKNRQIEVPLLRALVDIGGEAQAKQIYPLVTAQFPKLTQHDLAERLPSGPNKWINRIQWVRQKLINQREMDSPARGIWRITTAGRARLAGHHATPALAGAPTFHELYDDYVTSFRAQLLERLQNLSPREFEQFARRLLIAYGFVDVQVTQVGRDGGIDGKGSLRLGLASMNAAFQCKKWQGNVGRPEVDKFRGAIQGAFEQGVFFTTSDFTPDAREASLRRGAVPIILLNGEGIIDIMMEKQLGVERVPLYAYSERTGDFSDTDEE